MQLGTAIKIAGHDRPIAAKEKVFSTAAEEQEFCVLGGLLF